MTWTSVVPTGPSPSLPRGQGTDPSSKAGPILISLAEVVPVPVRWLWPGRIPLGKLTVLDGDPGVSKSLLSVDLAARVSRGLAMPDGSHGDLSGPVGVVLLSAEDDPADTVRPRLDAAGGDPARVVMLRAVRSTRTENDGTTRTRERSVTLADLPALRDSIRSAAAALVVVDPVMAFLGTDTDAHMDADIRSLLAPLAQLAAEASVAVMVVRHLRKSGATNPLYAGGGSIGIIGAARAGLMVVWDPDDAEGNRRILAPTKSNLAALPESMAYTVEPVHVESVGDVPRIIWKGTSPHTAADLMARAGERESGEKGNKRRSTRDAAADWLEAELRRTGGTRPVKEIRAEGAAAGYSWTTLRRAQEALGVESRRAGYSPQAGWVWALPPGALIVPPTDGQGAQANGSCPPKSGEEQVEHLGSNAHLDAPNGQFTQGTQPESMSTLGKPAPNGVAEAIPSKMLNSTPRRTGADLFPSTGSKGVTYDA